MRRLLFALALGACTDPGASPPDTEGTPDATVARPSSRAADAARKLGLQPNFLIGLGNDQQDAAFNLGQRLDIRYRYLVRSGSQGWPDWNTGGGFVTRTAQAARSNGAVPMYTLYELAAQGDGNTSITEDRSYMSLFWADVALLFDKLREFDSPAIVHFEPDFWAYAQQKSNGNPTAMKAEVRIAPDCSDLSDDLAGFGRCLVSMARKRAPKVLVGFHASTWGAYTNGRPDGFAVGRFLNEVGAGEADFFAIDMLDRDAGCFEVQGPNCQRRGSGWYWDETNRQSPNFHDHLAWATKVREALPLPILWWQLPLGVPSDTPGGTPGTYRDNRVRYIFSHPDEFAAAGGLGACFGTGAGGQTTVTTDGEQFRNALQAYRAGPTPLP
ncbi:MAG: hypothetical protein HY698_19645 [Deltaproteobacteria bacterium]|nr:hypothetical protein [Deltaproteobacteria bacterium]